MVRKVDRELKLEAIRMASLAQLPGRVPLHNRRVRVSVFPRFITREAPLWDVV